MMQLGEEGTYMIRSSVDCSSRVTSRFVLLKMSNCALFTHTDVGVYSQLALLVQPVMIYMYRSSGVIYRPRRDGRLSWPGWLTHSGRLTHSVVACQ